MSDRVTEEVTRIEQNPRLAELSRQGVAIWLDDLSRERLRTGNLRNLVDTYSVVGVTTNPTIFAGAVSGSTIYDDQIRDLAVRGVTAEEATRMVTTYDVRWAADVLSGVAAETGVDGRVSIEVDPRLAHDTERTIAEARALWWLVDRPNIFVKIPATVEGLPAISQALAEGISINVTLIFSLERYRQVQDAFLTGLERRIAAGGSIEGLESVASFFVSRVDSEIDDRLDAIGSGEAKAARGKAGIANAQLAYRAYEEMLRSERWQALAAKGARVQRPLWASTGVKNPAYPDTMYLSELVAPDTVNTAPEKTLKAYAEHGSVGVPVTERYAEAQAALETVSGLGVDLADVFAVLEREGVEKFEKSWDELLASVGGELARKAD